MVFGKAVPVGEIRLLLLQLRAVAQEYFAQVAGAAGAVDRATIPHAREYRQIAAVIEMGVREDDAVERVDGYRKRVPVTQTQVFRALEKPAVDQEAKAGALEEIFRSGDRSGCTEECQLHERSLYVEGRSGLTGHDSTDRSQHMLVSTHGGVRCCGRKHAPRTVFVPEEENCHGAFRSNRLDKYAALLAGMYAAGPGDVNGRRSRWCEPFFNQQSQGLFSEFHLHLLQRRLR
jgi:hypothetical protein